MTDPCAIPGPVPTEDQRRKICDLARASWSTGQIVSTLGIPAHTVKRVRKAAGLESTVGRPATGERDRITARVDEDVVVQLEANAERDDVTRSEIVEIVVTSWARGEPLPTRSRK